MKNHLKLKPVQVNSLFKYLAKIYFPHLIQPHGAYLVEELISREAKLNKIYIQANQELTDNIMSGRF